MIRTILFTIIGMELGINNFLYWGLILFGTIINIICLIIKIIQFAIERNN